MKPLLVEFAAFGSYPGQVRVDFTSLAARGLFVVTGDTGTGKTTIFDAMSYALFGDMPLKPGHDIRSHHAEPSQPTYARFTFAVDTHTYVAEWSPEQQRPAQRGGGLATQKATASLVRIDAAGGTTSLATKVSDMKRVVAEVVGLDAEQFRRVMLLPQGEVARFLLDDSGDRETLLSTLFGGAVYDRIATAMQNQANLLKQLVGTADEALRHHLANARARVDELSGLWEDETPTFVVSEPDGAPEVSEVDSDRLRTYLHDCAAPLEGLRARTVQAREAARRDVEALGAAQDAVERLEQAGGLRESLASLEATVPEVEARAVAARRSQTARPVVAAADQADLAAGDLDQARRAVDAAHGALVTLASSCGSPLRFDDAAQLQSDLDDLTSTVAEQTDRVGAVDEAVAARSRADQDLDERRRQLADARLELARHDERLAQIDGRTVELRAESVDPSALEAEAQRLAKAASDLALRDEVLVELKRCGEMLADAQSRSEYVLVRFIETTAPRLAAQLTAGAPCPVCGSHEHPNPAEADHGDQVDFDAVARAQADVSTAGDALRLTQTRLADVKAGLGEWAEVSIDRVQSLVEANQAQRDHAEVVSRELDGLAVDRDSVQQRVNQVQSECDRLSGLIDAGEASSLEAQARYEAAVAAASGVDRTRLETTRSTLPELRRLSTDLGTRRNQLEVAAATVRATEAAVHRALEASGFDEVGAARAALLPQHDESEALSQQASLDADLQRTRGELLTLERLGIPDEPPDVAALEEASLASQQQAAAHDKQCTLAEAAVNDLKAQLDDHDRIGAGSADLRRRASLADRAQLVLRGQVAPKVSLRRWVLGQELDRVVAAASAHLAPMTAGRYSLRRVTELVGGRSGKGLDLEIVDAHTGRARSPRTLSGGEQFQASLALALGLADVVSQGGAGSGRRIEALFIDEGFGSLDPRALDDAIETLHQLHASGRMIGAITHVEAMKERLHPGIVVQRLPDGKGSTLRVNP